MSPHKDDDEMRQVDEEQPIRPEYTTTKEIQEIDCSSEERTDHELVRPSVSFTIEAESPTAPDQLKNISESSLLNHSRNLMDNDKKKSPLFLHDDGGKDSVKKMRENLFIVVSGIYGILLVVLGAVIPISETFVVGENPFAFEAFYVYLYVVSVAFFIYVYTYLLRRQRLQAKAIARRLSRSFSFSKSRSMRSFDDAIESDNKPRLRSRKVSIDSHHHTGSFYLRFGAVAFGVGSMIHSGLNFGQYFQTHEGPAHCSDIVQAAKPLLHLMFTFSQMYFIFMNSKMCINRYTVFARFGLMHIAGTNICVWFRSIVVETLHVIHSHSHHGHKDETHTSHPQQLKASPGHMMDESVKTYVDYTDFFKQPDYDTTHLFSDSSGASGELNRQRRSYASDERSMILPELSCQWNDMMGSVVEAAGPYLFPCTIEYSLICAGILYVMWSNVSKVQRFRRQSSEDDDDDLRSHRLSVDCASSSKGLFLGILTFVGCVIFIIAFFMLSSKPEYEDQALTLVHLSETSIYLLTIVSASVAAFRMRELRFKATPSGLEDNLILLSFSGLIVFGIFSIIAALYEADHKNGALTILSNTMMMLQASMQTIFLLAGDRLSAADPVQVRKKPGREFVIFLLLCNFAMWCINTFTTQTPEHNPIQVKFYGPEAWAIFTHISVPLGIFYRFHSTVCLSNIWKNAWKHRHH